MSTEGKKRSLWPLLIFIGVILAIAAFCYYWFVVRPKKAANKPALPTNPKIVGARNQWATNMANWILTGANAETTDTSARNWWLAFWTRNGMVNPTFEQIKAEMLTLDHSTDQTVINYQNPTTGELEWTGTVAQAFGYN